MLLDEKADPFKASQEGQKILAEETNINHATIAVERYKKKSDLESDYNHHHVNRL
jgi:hypothetical protein